MYYHVSCLTFSAISYVGINVLNPANGFRGEAPAVILASASVRYDTLMRTLKLLSGTAVNDKECVHSNQRLQIDSAALNSPYCLLKTLCYLPVTINIQYSSPKIDVLSDRYQMIPDAWYQI